MSTPVRIVSADLMAERMWDGYRIAASPDDAYFLQFSRALRVVADSLGRIGPVSFDATDEADFYMSENPTYDYTIVAVTFVISKLGRQLMPVMESALALLQDDFQLVIDGQASHGRPVSLCLRNSEGFSVWARHPEDLRNIGVDPDGQMTSEN